MTEEYIFRILEVCISWQIHSNMSDMTGHNVMSMYVWESLKKEKASTMYSVYWRGGRRKNSIFFSRSFHPQFCCISRFDSSLSLINLALTGEVNTPIQDFEDEEKRGELFSSSHVLPNFDWRGKEASRRYWREGRETRIGKASSCQSSELFSRGPSAPQAACTSPCGSVWGQLLLRIWRGSGREPKKSGQWVPARLKPGIREI